MVVTFLYRRIGNEKATVSFQAIAFKFRISNNFLQDTNNFGNRQIRENARIFQINYESSCSASSSKGLFIAYRNYSISAMKLQTYHTPRISIVRISAIYVSHTLPSRNKPGASARIVNTPCHLSVTI